ncbi:hypothetical protein RRG08_056119 [Elysia crispata]|uniref:Uncharacterized protein n=1 Tax=Elysia crispata TaxID=231223 RepID=A0AAE1DTZ1_9GAST|nr:hypothetical protein RRG08_056119 [Elysia crispata]
MTVFNCMIQEHWNQILTRYLDFNMRQDLKCLYGIESHVSMESSLHWPARTLCLYRTKSHMSTGTKTSPAYLDSNMRHSPLCLYRTKSHMSIQLEPNFERAIWSLT